MIAFSQLGSHGRLGNAMFQYAAAKALSTKLGCQMKLPSDLFTRLHHGQICLLGRFNIEYKAYTDDEIKNVLPFNEHSFCNGGSYTEHFWNCGENTNLEGYFESELYFENIKNEIREDFQLKEQYQKQAADYINNIKMLYPEHEIIGVHIRRGDYLDPKNGAIFITTSEYNNQYLKNAIEKFSDIKHKIFLIFTGGGTGNNNDNSEDVLWCKNNITIENNDIVIFSENNDTITDFGILTLCDHLILNSSSTLGWWAGYLNKNTNKRIIVNNNLGFKSKETYWCDSFIKI